MISHVLFDPLLSISLQVLAQHSCLCHRHCSERSSRQPSGSGFRGLPLAQRPAPAQPGGGAHPGSWGEEEKAQRKRSREDRGGATAGPQPALQTQVRKAKHFSIEGSKHIFRAFVDLYTFFYQRISWLQFFFKGALETLKPSLRLPSNWVVDINVINCGFKHRAEHCKLIMSLKVLSC